MTKTKNITYYPNKEIFLRGDLVEINIDSFAGKSFDFFYEVCEIVYQKSTPLIKIEDESTEKYIMPYCFGNGLYYTRNVLNVFKDSIISDSTYHISKLKETLKKHLTNHGKNPKLSDSPDRAIISIMIDSTESIASLITRMLKVSKVFDEIINETDENLELKIFIDIPTPIPPIPPPPFLEIPQGTFKYELYYAEFGGRMDNSTCDVQIQGNRIKVMQDGTTNLTGGKVIFEGLLIKHKSGVWILADEESEKDAEEVGGCTEIPVIYFEKNLIEWC